MSDWFADQLTRIGLAGSQVEALAAETTQDRSVAILLVDDAPANLQVLQGTLKPLGHKILAARDGETALAIAQRSKPALVLLDVMMPGIDGYEVCRRIKADPDLAQTAVIFCSALDDTAAKIRGLQLGAVDFVTKPFEPDEVLARVNAQLATQLLARSLGERNRALARELAVARTQKLDALRRMDWVLRGSSSAIVHLRQQVQAAADSEGPVLLFGAADTGAEAVARALHAASPRAERPFLTLSGGHLFDSRTQGELSAFQIGGAAPSRLELADGGTLFVDLLERFPAEALQSLGSYLTHADEARRQGRTPVPDTRIVAVLEPQARRGFPERLQVHPTALSKPLEVELPTLRERPSDLLELACAIAKSRLDTNGEAFPGFDDDSARRLTQHDWPGNLREFEDIIVRAVASRGSGPIYVDSAHLQSGIPLGSYRLLRRLGQGGFGEVWEARHQLLARPAAVKLILGSSVADPLVVERFRREATATANLASPHTVTLYDFGVSESGQFYYVMELLDGTDLEHLVAKHGNLPPERLTHFLIQACRSLAEAHQSGLVHRDIKPSNLFACKLGIDVDVLKVLDFGLVRRQEQPSAAHLTQQDAIIGTPAFMAPEVALGQPIDGRTDVYSLCATAWMLAVGREPFRGETGLAVIMGHMLKPAPPIREEVPGFPPALAELIEGGLAKDPSARPTARELLRALVATGLGQAWDEERRLAWWAQHRPELGEHVGTEQPTSLSFLPG